MTNSLIICDLDDTLIKTDILLESVLKLIRTQPLRVLALPFWFARSKAFAKSKIANLVTIDPATLPYRDEVLRLIRERRQSGARTILASASNERVVRAIAEHLQCFDDVKGSSDTVNLKSGNKLAWIKETFNNAPFEYVGDSAADLPIWKSASRATLVNPSAAVLASVKQTGVAHAVISDKASSPKLIVRQMRVHQWIKNALLAVPLVAAHRIFDWGSWQNLIVGMMSFSLIASFVYVMNDMLDIDNDRQHPTKKNRPFASGLLPLRTGFLLAPALGLASLTLASALGPDFAAVIILYLVTNILYSTRFKESVMLDVVILASFYTMRLMAGSAATDVVISHWLLSFSTFFFLGLAMVKRYTELLRVVGRSKKALFGRGYTSEDRLPVLIMGITSSLVSIVILALYFHSPEMLALYSRPTRLWVLAPLMLFWNGRIWMLTNRGLVDDDPVVFAVRDRTSWGVLIAIGLALVFAS
jgi:4-hydroxybenzoate polyprenyltransferase/phosphoserine phosphatase